MTSLSYSNEAEWHTLRARHVGASESAALFGLSPWMTHWQLYMQKSGQLPAPDLGSNDAVAKGRHFEPGIASFARERFEIDLRKVRRYLVADDCPRMGASLDYEQTGTGSLVPTEIKWVERPDGWDWSGEEITQIPDHYLMQVQHQIGCANAASGQLIAVVGGTVRRMLIPRSDILIAKIKGSIQQFWMDVENKIEPLVDFLKDADAISDLAYARPLRTIELSPEAESYFAALLDAKAQKKIHEDVAKAAESHLVKMVLDAGIGNDGKAVATCGGYKMSLTKVDENPGKVIDVSMIGEIIGRRAGYLRPTVSNIKEPT